MENVPSVVARNSDADVRISATMITLWRQSVLAGLLFMPHLAWVGFASVLNFAIWRLNWQNQEMP